MGVLFAFVRAEIFWIERAFFFFFSLNFQSGLLSIVPQTYRFPVDAFKEWMIYNIQECVSSSTAQTFKWPLFEESFQYSGCFDTQ